MVYRSDMLRRLASTAGVGLVVALVATAAAQSFPRFGTGCARADFRSSGSTVRAERCGPASGARAVIVLHGCGGFDTFDHRLATSLPRDGITTLDVDYFGPTPPPGKAGFCHGFAGGPDPFPIWERVAADAAASLRPHFAHVGAVGWSLGAGVAVEAAEDRHPFDALAAFSTFAFGPTLDRVRLLPPSIFLDGGTHDIVPPANAKALYAAARRAHVPTALYIYGDGSHGWPGAQGTAGIARAAAFLRRHLS
jgi:dienelactone hydrolase